jgi:sensor histidine kinase regulating citrate/malate metabolism
LSKDPAEIFGKASGQLIHDIRNHLNTVIGFSSLLLGNSKLEKEELSYITKISDAGYLIEKLLSEISGYINDDYEDDPKRINLTKAVSDFLESNKMRNQERKITVSFSNKENISANTSEDIIKKILDSLFEFSAKGLKGTNIDKTIFIELIQKNKDVVLYYSDTSNSFSIKKDFFSTEEILNSRRGLSLFFLEKYVEKINGDLKYFSGKEWENESKALENKAASHGFRITIHSNL